MAIDNSDPAADSGNIDRKYSGKRTSVQTDKSRVNKRPGSRTASSFDNLDVLHVNELIRSTPDVRRSRVEQIKSDIHNGRYNVKAEKIAEKILENYLSDNLFQS